MFYGIISSPIGVKLIAGTVDCSVKVSSRDATNACATSDRVLRASGNYARGRKVINADSTISIECSTNLQFLSHLKKHRASTYINTSAICL